MQSRLLGGADSIAAETHSAVAPVGEAWRECRHAHPDIELFAPDGSHPSLAGTSLAACVIVETVTATPCAGDPVPSGLSVAVAAALRAVAHHAVSGP